MKKTGLLSFIKHFIDTLVSKWSLKNREDELLLIHSRYIAEKTMRMTDNGDSYLAQRLVVEALPHDLNQKDRPYATEAEIALRHACQPRFSKLRHPDSRHFIRQPHC